MERFFFICAEQFEGKKKEEERVLDGVYQSLHADHDGAGEFFPVLGCRLLVEI